MTVIVHDPGTLRSVHYWGKRDENGKLPVTLWGTVEEQIAEATAENARAISSHEHTTMQLYMMAEDCPHTNPEDDDRYRDVNDLVDEWMRRNTPGLTWRDGDLFYRNQKRAQANVPLYVAWQTAQFDYDDTHNRVCLDEPMGSCCTACTEGDDDSGHESSPCRLADNVRETYDEFWWRVSPEGIADRSRP